MIRLLFIILDVCLMGVYLIVQKKEPLELSLDKVIKGWRIVLGKMKKGWK